MDEVEYTVINDHTGEELPVIGFHKACDEAYAQCCVLPCYAEIRVYENAAEKTVVKFIRDGYEITRS